MNKKFTCLMIFVLFCICACSSSNNPGKDFLNMTMCFKWDNPKLYDELNNLVRMAGIKDETKYATIIKNFTVKDFVATLPVADEDNIKVGEWEKVPSGWKLNIYLADIHKDGYLNFEVETAYYFTDNYEYDAVCLTELMIGGDNRNSSIGEVYARTFISYIKSNIK